MATASSTASATGEAFALPVLALRGEHSDLLLPEVLAAMAEAGDKGATTALKRLENPTQFLSSVQVGAWCIWACP